MNQERLNQRPLHVLIVEDSEVVALDLAEILADAGCCVVGPTGDLQEALVLQGQTPVDVALLDIRVGGEPVFLLAAELRRRGVRLVFYSGNDPESVLPAEFLDCVGLQKPAAIDAILSAVGLQKV
jgi:DNA-binding NarL/FixJ family response regulator